MGSCWILVVDVIIFKETSNSCKACKVTM